MSCVRRLDDHDLDRSSQHHAGSWKRESFAIKMVMGSSYVARDIEVEEPDANA